MVEQMAHILVPVDFSEHSDTALRHATMFAQRVNGSIELLHVVEDPFARMAVPVCRICSSAASPSASSARRHARF